MASVATKRKKKQVPAAKTAAKTFNRDAILYSLRRIEQELAIIKEQLSPPKSYRSFLDTVSAVVPMDRLYEPDDYI
jgi:hypothetical protein